MVIWRGRLRTLSYFFLQYRRVYLFIILLSIMGGVLEGANMGMLLVILEIFRHGLGAAASNIVGGQYLGIVLQRFPDIDLLILACLAFILINLVRNITSAATDFAIVSTSGRVMHDVRQRAYRTYARADYLFLIDHKVGELSYNSSMPPKALAKALSTVPKLVVETCRIAGMFVLLFWANPTLTLLILGLTALLYVPATWLMGRKFYDVGLISRDANTRMSALLTEFFSGIRHILIGNAKLAWLKELDSINATLRTAYVREAFFPGLPKNIIEVLVVTTILGIVILLKLMLSPGAFQDSLSFLGLFGYALIRIVPPLTTINRIPVDLANAMPEIERLYGILHEVVSSAPRGHKPALPLRQGIVFERVTFAYPECAPLFNELSLEFRKGQFFAIVGPSGAGKTTIINLILGLYAPTAGRVLVDRVDLREIDLTSWYQRIGFVSQDIFIFHASVLDNIRLYNANYGLDEVEEAAKMSFAHEFIMQLSKGYSTIVGERGMRLSGGQQQRLALARALLHKPKVLLLDEATSALDNESERLVQLAIRNASQERTVIAIAHRLSTIEQADVIYVLDKGQVVAQGRHRELIAQPGVYATLQAAVITPVADG